MSVGNFVSYICLRNTDGVFHCIGAICLYSKRHSSLMVRPRCTQLELGNMGKTGELKEMWDMAAKTNLQFNMVRDAPLQP